MRKFEVIKELPGISLGAVLFKEDGNDTLDDCDGCPTGLVLVDGPDGPLLRMQGGDRLADFNDWLEEIEPEYKRWRADFDGKYYFVYPFGNVIDDKEQETPGDNDRYNIGNYFKTKEEAQAVADYLKALTTVRDDAKGFVPDWSDDEQPKIYVRYLHQQENLSVGRTWRDDNNGVFGLPYFATEEDAEESIEKHEKEWKTIFGIKNNEEEE